MMMVVLRNGNFVIDIDSKTKRYARNGVVFKISIVNDKTKTDFLNVGLVLQVECYKGTLLKLLTE